MARAFSGALAFLIISGIAATASAQSYSVVITAPAQNTQFQDTVPSIGCVGSTVLKTPFLVYATLNDEVVSSATVTPDAQGNWTCELPRPGAKWPNPEQLSIFATSGSKQLSKVVLVDIIST